MIEGSDVQFALEMNREPQTAALELETTGDASPRTIPLAIQGTKLTGMIPKVDDRADLRDRGQGC